MSRHSAPALEVSSAEELIQRAGQAGLIAHDSEEDEPAEAKQLITLRNIPLILGAILRCIPQ